MTSPSQDNQKTIREDATLWFARLRGGDVTPQTQQAFSHWMKSNPEHEVAFNRVRAAWDILGALPASQRPQPPKHAFGRREIIGGAIAASVAGYFLLNAVPAQAKIFQTAIGEQKRFTLPDGSNLLLDTASKVSARCNAQIRNATVDCGRAHFEVSGTVDNALSVQAGDILVASHHGIFDVFRGSDSIHVFLQKNDATVQTADGTSLTLQAGERITIPFPHGLGVVDHPKQDTITAWQRGLLIFDQTTLEDAVREMNRYSRIRLTLKDAKIAQMKISGAYGAGKAAEFLHGITLLLPVRAERRGDAFEIVSSQ